MVEHKFDKEQQFGELTDLLLDYFRMFGDKTCCANDLKLFLEYVEPAKRPGFAAQLMQECRINPVTLPSSVSLGSEAIVKVKYDEISLFYRKSTCNGTFARCRLPGSVVLTLP